MSRFIRSPGTLYTVRTARKDLECQGDTGERCHSVIRRGERYTRSALPPDSEFGNVGWWTARLCSECMAIEEPA